MPLAPPAATPDRYAIVDPVRTPAAFDIAGEIARRRAENDKWAPATLLPAEAFSDEPAGEAVFRRLCEPDAPRGRHAWAVHRRIMSSCAGWEKRPTADEFYDAVRASRPTDRQKVIIRMWGAEATLEDLVEAWAQQAYTFRQLVRALHRAGFSRGSRIRTINRWARKL